MKILIITNHSYMLYRFRRELIAALQKDHEVVLSMPFVGHEADFKAMGLRCVHTDVDRRGIDPRTDGKLFLTYWKLLKAEEPDMVITYSIKPNIYAGLACRMLKIPFCANVQGLGTAFQRKRLVRLVTLLYRTALRKAKTVFFENSGNAREFLNRRIIRKDQVTVLAGAGVNLEEYPLVPYPENGAFHFLYLGRIMEEKGIGELFSAMERLHEELGGRAVLDMVGFFDDDYEAQVRSLADRGIAVFHGFQTEPGPFYAAADCVVLPSYHEGMSNVLLEAAATGRPVITSSIFGCREAVEDGVTGLLCRVKNSGDLYEKMRAMADMPRQDREAMGKAARAKMEREFEKSMIVEKTVRAILDGPIC